ncbi:MAG TPA: biotin transporter BioY [bacterium]
MIIYNRNRIIISIGLFTALTAVGAYIKIPLPHVPVTLQTFFVIMSGNLLGWRYGTISQMSYLVLGLIGLPIFAYGGGPGYIFQPSFGFLLGYPIAAFTIGLLLNLSFSNHKYNVIERIRPVLRIIFADLIGVLIIFITGLSYLYLNIKYNLYLNIESATVAGLNFKNVLQSVILLFFPVDLLKVILASWVTLKLNKQSIYSFINF